MDQAIFFCGLVLAVVAGKMAYNQVGLYGDGFLNVGLHHMTNPATGRLVLYREVRGPDGNVERYVDDPDIPPGTILVTDVWNGTRQTVGFYRNQGRLESVTLDRNGDGLADLQEDYDGLQVRRRGFSVDGSGVINAWEYFDAAGAVLRVEVARQPGGAVDRWEYYAQGQLSRVEQDDDHDGKVDHWFWYEDGILVHETRDHNRDGQPDSRP